jgi:serine protease Do
MSDPAPQLSFLEQLSDALGALVLKVTPSIVALTGSGDDFKSSGSGFLIDDQGHVVTNFHVVDGLSQPLDAGMHGGGRRKATVLGSDPLTDLSLLKLEDPPPAAHLTLRDKPAQLGELCIGLGSPFGMYPESVAMGVVSGLARTITQDGRRPIENAIQTDVAINPGNSGGPLIDVRGEVIGVNNCTDSRGTGIGFAIPAETVRAIADELKEFGHIARAALGVTVVRRPVEVAGTTYAGLAVTRTKTANNEGLLVDDVIVKLAGQVTDEPGDLYRILTRSLIDQPTNVQVVRGGALFDLTIRPSKLEPPSGS